MKTIVYIFVVLVVAAGAWFFFVNGGKFTGQPEVQGAPSQVMGINGSPNQGNLGQPDNGTPQQPQDQSAQTGDGSPIDQNITIGTGGNATVGIHLIGWTGMTLYSYDKDRQGGGSSCTGTCAQNWPPYTVPKGMSPNIQAGVNGNVGTIVRADGTTQITYNGKPLYFYIGDKANADMTGNGVGGVWHVVTP